MRKACRSSTPSSESLMFIGTMARQLRSGCIQKATAPTFEALAARERRALAILKGILIAGTIVLLRMPALRQAQAQQRRGAEKTKMMAMVPPPIRCSRPSEMR